MGKYGEVCQVQAACDPIRLLRWADTQEFRQEEEVRGSREVAEGLDPETDRTRARESARFDGSTSGFRSQKDKTAGRPLLYLLSTNSSLHLSSI